MAFSTMTKSPKSRKGMKTRNGRAPECNRCDCGGHSWAPLTQGRVTLVSPEDEHHLAQWHWTSHRGYASRIDTSLGAQHLHRLVCGSRPGMYTDHKNGNPSDNRRDNLRECTPQQNAFNARKKRKQRKNKGVRKSKNKWEARIGHNWNQIYIGRFKTEEEAVAAYNNKAIELYGEFAKLNSG